MCLIRTKINISDHLFVMKIYWIFLRFRKASNIWFFLSVLSSGRIQFSIILTRIRYAVNELAWNPKRFIFCSVIFFGFRSGFSVQTSGRLHNVNLFNHQFFMFELREIICFCAFNEEPRKTASMTFDKSCLCLELQ